MTQYSLAVVDEILSEIAAGKALVQICKRADMPTTEGFYGWLREDRDGLADRYARARITQAHTLAEQIISIADDGSNDTYVDDEGNPKTDHDHIQRSKLRVDARKWYASKLAPKFYGDKLALGGDAENPLRVMSVKELTDDQLIEIAANAAKSSG